MKHKLKEVIFEITNRCNLRCIHCASNSGETRPDEMSFSEIKSIIIQIKNLGAHRITLLGGEVFLRSDWHMISEEVKKQKMDLNIITNGLLINGDIISKLTQLPPQVIGVSLDGACASTYKKIRGVDKFESSLQALHQIKEANIPVTAITTFMSCNLADFDLFVELLQDTGIGWQVQLAHVGGDRFNHEQVLNEEQYTLFTEKVKDLLQNKSHRINLLLTDDFGYFPLDPTFHFLHQTWNGCKAGRSVLGIRSNGDILGCLSLGDKFIEANVRKTPLSNIWNSKTHFEQFRSKTKYLQGTCAKCPFAKKCLAGCTSMAESGSGHIGDNTFCLRRRETESLLKSFL